MNATTGAPLHGATHEVFNQAPPFEDVDLFGTDAALCDAVRFNAPGLDTAALSALGAEAGSAAMLSHARLANLHPPVLHTHDRTGRRIDEVEFHPSYHVLLGAALRHGLHGAPWGGQGSGHVGRAAGFVLATQLEPSVLCPVSMTYAVTPALRANPALQQAFGGLLASRAYDARFIAPAAKTAITMGMGMTEKQGGSDVRANTTRAVRDGDDAWGERWRLVGHKWFMSAPMSDAFLVVAQAPAGPTCFFLPRRLPDGTLNAVRIQRLKDKLGNHANASSEVEFVDAFAWRVGEEGRGLPQILAMGALTRLDCALGSAGLMRGALALALHHARHRRAFGKRLEEHALMRNVLADMALESEAAA
ncbi:MAG TPA: acyl-CoA dehydrogenase family protein, partial [Burkholderiaceae bacterium]